MLLDKTIYPATVVEDLFSAAYLLIRSFELAPWASGNLDERVEKAVNDGRV